MRSNDPSRPLAASPRRGWRAVVALAIGLAIVAAALFVPIPIFFGYLPGPVRDIEGLVSVRGAPTYSSEGSLYLTTVSVDSEVTFLEWVVNSIDPSKAVVTRESVTGGQSLDEVRRQQRREMSESQLDAKVVALSALDVAHPEGDGAVVEATVDGPAQGVLRTGDVIVAVDGRPTGTLCDVGRAIGEHRPGEEIELRVRRGGDTELVTIAAGNSRIIPGRAFLGIAMAHEFEFDPDIEVSFEAGRIAGPSAGLMFALTLFDRLTPDDLTDGRDVAGTGTINCDGSVGPIGGIEQKVAGAEMRGAEVFLAPIANAGAARAAADDIEVVAVRSFDDALDYLQGT